MAQTYSFNVEVAEAYGIEESIMIKSFQYWIGKNATAQKNSHDGFTWTYNSAGALTDRFPFWSERQIRRILKSLIDRGVLQSGNYNKKQYDRTAWYSFKDEVKWLQATESTMLPNGEMAESTKLPNGNIHLPKRSDASTQNVTPIPITNTSTNQVRDKDITSFEDFWSVYPKKNERKKCAAIWKRRALDDIGAMIVADVESRLLSDGKWIKDGGKYVPYPQTYLNGDRWEDEIQMQKQSQVGEYKMNRDFLDTDDNVIEGVVVDRTTIGSTS
jgi:hypothetical protein